MIIRETGICGEPQLVCRVSQSVTKYCIHSKNHISLEGVFSILAQEGVVPMVLLSWFKVKVALYNDNKLLKGVSSKFAQMFIFKSNDKCTVI
jgi:hypothetical protein